MKIITFFALFLLLGLSVNSASAQVWYSSIPDFSYHADEKQRDMLNDVRQLLADNGLAKDSMTAEDYNSAGKFFCDKHRWKEAEMVLRMANKEPHSSRSAYYNLACVLSQCDGYLQNPKESEHPNPIMEGNHPYGNALWYLFLSLLPQDVNLLPGYVAIDAEWAAKARNDAALANLREAAPALFDAMTLPDAEKEVREFQGIYKGWSGWEGHRWLAFAEADGEEGERRIMVGHDVAPFPKEYDKFFGYEYFPDYENNPLVGKKFRIKYVDSPYYDDMAGLLTNDRMISFEEIK